MAEQLHSCLDGAVAGFFGKLPSRGDFIRSGLPSSFVTPWDAWMSGMIAGSRDRLGEGWQPAWMEAPIWFFALAPGLCGPDGVMGLWMPSVDRAGRLYPLTIASVAGHASVAAMTATGAAFLAEAARAGLDALEHEWQPDALAARVGGAIRGEGAAVEAAVDLRGASLWWTDGSPLVPASAFALPDLPGENLFARMLDARDTDMVA